MLNFLITYRVYVCVCVCVCVYHSHLLYFPISVERPTTPDDTLSVAEKNSKIKDWLLYWLLRRPTVESLKEKGILKGW